MAILKPRIFITVSMYCMLEKDELGHFEDIPFKRRSFVDASPREIRYHKADYEFDYDLGTRLNHVNHELTIGKLSLIHPTIRLTAVPIIEQWVPPPQKLQKQLANYLRVTMHANIPHEHHPQAHRGQMCSQRNLLPSPV
jgi:hypothetical protein